jgi:uncharacterized protein YbjQ (UPF0145 family)
MTRDATAHIPAVAVRRLESARAFTSALSVPEFALAGHAQLRPLAQVVGSCFYHLGWQQMPTVGGYRSPDADAFWGWRGAGGWGRGQTFELQGPTDAWNEARRRAVARLAAEARHAGGDAVVSVRITRRRFDWSDSVIEFVAFGTAARADERAPAPDDGPVLSNLTAAELLQLRRCGWRTAGLVAATSVCCVLSGWKQQYGTSWTGRRWVNQELPDFTRGFYDARAQAMLRVERQARELAADGIVATVIETEQHEHEGDLYLTVHVLGTAIAEDQPREPEIYAAIALNEEGR